MRVGRQGRWGAGPHEQGMPGKAGPLSAQQSKAACLRLFALQAWLCPHPYMAPCALTCGGFAAGGLASKQQAPHRLCQHAGDALGVGDTEKGISACGRRGARAGLKLASCVGSRHSAPAHAAQNLGWDLASRPWIGCPAREVELEGIRHQGTVALEDGPQRRHALLAHLPGRPIAGAAGSVGRAKGAELERHTQVPPDLHAQASPMHSW